MLRRLDFLIRTLLVGMLAFFIGGIATATADEPPFPFPRNSMAPEGPDAMDLTPEMLGADEIAIRQEAARIGSALATNSSVIGAPAVVGEEFTILVSDNGLGIQYPEDFVVVLDGTHGIILIEKAAYDSFDGTGYTFPNPNGCWRPADYITHAQLEYLLGEFDNNMWPTNTSVFGEPLPRGDEGQKVWTLIFNIRDGSYYDCSQTSYIAGYFSASTSASENKNIMHIDTYNWEDRTGPDADRPFLYEGTFAHEFEHLIHFDIDPDEPSWVDEGLADLAGFLCGYGHSSGHVAYYMVYHPFTALTYWGGGLEDYGASYLFQLYLFEQFGGAAFTSALVQDEANGIEGIENTLSDFGFKESFDEVFDRWTVANYVDDTRKSGGMYGYKTLDVGSVDTWGYSIEYALANFWWGPPDMVPFFVSSGWLGDPLAYTAQYYRFNGDDTIKIWLDGDDFTGNPAYSGTYQWYSDKDAWAWRSFYQTFDIPGGGATLQFMTSFDIEYDWDYGYVEVYDQDTGEWYTLDAAGTVNYVAFPQDNPNVPTHREPTAYESAGRWHAFTGNSGGWVPVSMDLTPFAGHSIDLYFTTWQDPYVSFPMMYVDDVSIPELGFFDDVESGEDGWSSTGWYVTDGLVPNGFAVATMDTKWVPAARYPEPAGNNGMSLHKVRYMTVDEDTQSGEDSIPETPVDSGRVQVSVVSNQVNHEDRSAYLFGGEYK